MCAAPDRQPAPQLSDGGAAPQRPESAVPGRGAALAAPGEPDAQPATGPATAAQVKIKLNTIIDQGLDQEIALLSAPKLKAAHRRYADIYGDASMRECDARDAQLTALSWRVLAGLALYVDFGLWGPWGAHLERRFKFVAHFQNPYGLWRAVEIPGPADLTTWRSCFGVFRVAAVMPNILHPAILDRYEAMFESWCRQYPFAWQICLRADIICRGEWVLEESRRQGLFKMRWTVQRQVCLSSIQRCCEIQPGVRLQLTKVSGSASSPSRLCRAHMVMVRHLLCMHCSSQIKAVQHHRLRSQRDTPPAPRRRRAGTTKRMSMGRFKTTRKGIEICRLWNCSETGCKVTCPYNRAHACGICRDTHRIVHHGNPAAGRNKKK